MQLVEQLQAMYLDNTTLVRAWNSISIDRQAELIRMMMTARSDEEFRTIHRSIQRELGDVLLSFAKPLELLPIDGALR